jgi:hypothetical protein
MRPYKSLFLTISILLGISLVACNLPAPPATSPPPLDQSAANTAAAETIVAQLTEVAETLTPTAPTDTQEVPTETAVLPTATFTATSSEPPQTPTATSTPAPSPTATLPAGDPITGLGEPEFIDPFDNGTSWPLYTDDHVSFEVKDSNLVMTAFNPDKYNGWMLTWPVIRDFYLEMTAETTTCSSLDQYGVMLRATKTNKGYIGYLFGLSCDGKYSLRRWDGDKYVSLVDWTSSEHIQSGSNQTNRLGIKTDGTKISMYANGNLLQEINDDTHQEGRFGVFVGSANTKNVKFLADEIAYWDIP